MTQGGGEGHAHDLNAHPGREGYGVGQRLNSLVRSARSASQSALSRLSSTTRTLRGRPALLMGRKL